METFVHGQGETGEFAVSINHLVSVEEDKEKGLTHLTMLNGQVYSVHLTYEETMRAVAAAVGISQHGGNVH